MATIKAGIIGGAGYTGGELLRLLCNHPTVNIAFIHSKSNAGKNISDIHEDLEGETDLRFSPDFSAPADVVFMCVGHGEAKKFLNEHHAQFQNTRIIDLSQDFRLHQQGER